MDRESGGESGHGARAGRDTEIKCLSRLESDGVDRDSGNESGHGARAGRDIETKYRAGFTKCGAPVTRASAGPSRLLYFSFMMYVRF